MLRKYSLVESYKEEAKRSSEGSTLKLPVCVPLLKEYTCLSRLEEQRILTCVAFLRIPFHLVSDVPYAAHCHRNTGRMGSKVHFRLSDQRFGVLTAAILGGSLSPLCPAKV